MDAANDDKVLLGLDPASTTGFALHSPGSRVVCGQWELRGEPRFESIGMMYLRFRQRLNEIAASMGRPPAIVGYEEVRQMRGGPTVQIYSGLIGELQSWCDSFGVAYVGIPVGSVKKLATGNGGAPKEAVIDAAKQRWPEIAGVDITDNMADALWIMESVRRGRY